MSAKDGGPRSSPNSPRPCGTIAGLLLLDYSADPSHNRSVFTMAGDAGAVRDGTAAHVRDRGARIDLRTHRGVHPRIGAVDVVPFVPLGEATMAECVDLSRAVGHAIAERFEVPVFLYEQSATRPERRRLEQIRRGQFEGLAEKMTQPDWAPDFGPPVPHPTAGATVVGARMPLIAFNVDLDSPDVDVARADRGDRARERRRPALREGARASALTHRGVAQVSMNLTDYTRTSIQTVFDEVAAPARRHAGFDVLESELIGLIPAGGPRGHVRAAATEAATASRRRRFSRNAIAQRGWPDRDTPRRSQMASSSASDRREGGMPKPRILRYRLLRSTPRTSAVRDMFPCCSASVRRMRSRSNRSRASCSVSRLGERGLDVGWRRLRMRRGNPGRRPQSRRPAP